MTTNVFNYHSAVTLQFLTFPQIEQNITTLVTTTTNVVENIVNVMSPIRVVK